MTMFLSILGAREKKREKKDRGRGRERGKEGGGVKEGAILEKF